MIQTEAEKYELLRKAVISRACVMAMYKEKRRELCVHVLGKKNGEPQALCFQCGGDSASGLKGANWRCLPVAGLSEIVLQEGTWHGSPRTGVQKCVDEIDVEVAEGT